MDKVLEIIARRRAIYPDRFNDEEISPDEVAQLLEAARYAPTHKLTEPWRFHVLMGDAKQRYSLMVSDHIETKSGNQEKASNFRKKFEQSQAVIVVNFQRDPQERLPEWEEIAATAMAVQNIWVYAGGLGMGGYWSTGEPAVKALSQLIKLNPGETILGMFFLGRYDDEPRKRPAKPVDKFTTWLNS